MGVKLGFLASYAAIPRPEYAHTLVINYAGLTPQALPEAMERLSAVFSQWL